jgi:hypothetical protein
MPGTLAKVETITDILVTCHVYGLAGPVTVERPKTPLDPTSFLLKHAGFALDYPEAIHKLTRTGVSFFHTDPKPTENEAHAFLSALMPAGWTLENVDQLDEIHRVRPSGWYSGPPSAFAFGFRIQRDTGTSKLPLRKTPNVSGLALAVDHLLVIQSQ